MNERRATLACVDSGGDTKALTYQTLVFALNVVVIVIIVTVMRSAG
jgi:hypothetical protein